ncbi:hypothetical protein DM02DRAFT_178574 [Periconia macrospinosa]|uniref:Uncharacterized protein n=1 Tax=Periconia macrospinosa TaxID=97972 RepID=A0A2V1E2D6_9PLEO|nr:hypothetical protein DM02DRAFT_178574 [Periconia macrospinosa]
MCVSMMKHFLFAHTMLRKCNHRHHCVCVCVCVCVCGARTPLPLLDLKTVAILGYYRQTVLVDTPLVETGRTRGCMSSSFIQKSLPSHRITLLNTYFPSIDSSRWQPDA